MTEFPESVVDYLAKRLDKLVHPEGTIIKLVNFHHDSPGLRKLRRQMSEAILSTLLQCPDVEMGFRG